MGGAALKGFLGVTCATAVLALAAGCGGSSSSSSSSPAGNASSAASSAMSSATSSTGSGSGSMGASAYCAHVKAISTKLRAEFASIGAVASQPAKLKTIIQDEQQALNDAAQSAPSAIQPQVQTIASALQPFFQTLQKYNYNVMKAAPHLRQNVLDAPKVKAAEQKLASWAKANGCTTSS